MLATVHELHPLHPGRRSVLRVLDPGIGALHPDRVAFQGRRHDVYCGPPRFWEPEHPGRQETDEDDSRATYITVSEQRGSREIIVGGCRIIPSGNEKNLLPLERRGECSSLIPRPCLEISRMIVCKAHPTSLHELYRGIYAAISSPTRWGCKILSACAVVEPYYLENLQERFSREIFHHMPGTDEIQAKTGTGKRIQHLLMNIDINAWSDWYQSHDAMKIPAAHTA